LGLKVFEVDPVAGGEAPRARDIEARQGIVEPVVLQLEVGTTGCLTIEPEMRVELVENGAHIQRQCFLARLYEAMPGEVLRQYGARAPGEHCHESEAQDRTTSAEREGHFRSFWLGRAEGQARAATSWQHLIFHPAAAI